MIWKATKFNKFICLSLLIFQMTTGSIFAQSSSPSKSPANSGKSDEPQLTAGPVDISKHPNAKVNFTIEKEGSFFQQLETSDVEVLVDDQKVELKPNSLVKGKESEAVKVLFVIDKSGSMKIGVDKLGAAKDAMRNFVENLSPNDQIALSTFGDDYLQVLPLTKVEDKSTINQAIDKIVAGDEYTTLYDSVKSATDQADRAGIKNIIFLSDGKEYSTEFNKLKIESDIKNEKTKREKDLSGKLNDKGIRFFAVAIGKTNVPPKSEEYVDFDTMKNIAEPTQGKADLVNMQIIQEESKGDSEKQKAEIAKTLKGQLAEIKKALKFSYELSFDLPKNMKDSGEMLLKFKITDGNKRWEQKTTYPYSMRDGKPFFEKARVLPFITSLATKNLSYLNISLIYLLMLLPLGILSLIPGIFNKFAAIAEEKKVNQSIVQVYRGSHLLGKQCPNEGSNWSNRFAFHEGDTLIVCPQCGTPHHLTCWAENKFQCMNRLCQSRYQIPAQILSRHNVQV